MPDTFEFPELRRVVAAARRADARRHAWRRRAGLRVFGVLQPGVTFEAATTESNQLSAQVPSADGRRRRDRARCRCVRSPATRTRRTSRMSALVFVLVMVLLVVASNVATLVFARTWSRAPELAVRTALGAARTRVVGQLFFETLLLGSIAAVDRAGRRVQPRSTTSRARSRAGRSGSRSSPNPRIVAFVVFLTLLVSAVSGLLPALRVTRHDLRNTLQAGRGFAFGGFGRAGAVLLVVEIALSVALLNGAVTMARAFDVATSTRCRRCRRTRC